MFKSTGHLITQFSVLSILLGASVLSNAPIASAQPQQLAQRTSSSEIKELKYKAIDRYTDHFFYAANPELNNRKLRRGEAGYGYEWNVIRQAISPLVQSSHDACVFGRRNGDAYWEFNLKTQDGRNSYDYLTDVIYYHRNPEMAGIKLRPNTDAAHEWSRINKKMYISVCGI